MQEEAIPQIFKYEKTKHLLDLLFCKNLILIYNFKKSHYLSFCEIVDVVLYIEGKFPMWDKSLWQKNVERGKMKYTVSRLKHQ